MTQLNTRHIVHIAYWFIGFTTVVALRLDHRIVECHKSVLFRSAFPEILKAATKLSTAESDDGVGTTNGPMHAGSFETCADGHLASDFHNAGGSAQALGVELGVAHTVSVALEIVQAATCFLRARDLATDGVEQSRSAHSVARG